MIKLIEIINRATLSPDFVQDYYWKVRKIDNKEAIRILFDYIGFDKHLHDLDSYQLKKLYNDLKEIEKTYNAIEDIKKKKKLEEIFNKSRITTEDINNLIIDIIAYRGTMGSGEVWKILGIFGITKDTDDKGTAHQKINSLDQNQKNDLYYKLKNLMNLNEIKSVSPINAPANIWRQGIDEEGNEYDDLDFDRMYELFKKYQHKEFSDLSDEKFWKEVEEYTNNIDDGEDYKDISIKDLLEDFRMWLDNIDKLPEIKSSASPLDAPANLIVNGKLDWKKLENIFEKYKDKFFPKMGEEDYIDLVNSYISDEIGEEAEEENIDYLKNLTIGQVMNHVKKHYDFMEDWKKRGLDYRI